MHFKGSLQQKMKEKRRPSVNWMDPSRGANAPGRPATPSAGSSPLHPEYRLEESIRNRRHRTGSFRYHVDLDDISNAGSGQDIDYFVNKVKFVLVWYRRRPIDGVDAAKSKMLYSVFEKFEKRT